MKNNNLAYYLFLPPLLLYRYIISPIIPRSCRFKPSCSCYMIEAIRIHGFYGLYLGLKRLIKCHPFAPWGFDPVPEYRDKMEKKNGKYKKHN
ncbi:MAG: membrane protein insertion efficiency factor YidD [Alphaproteobacteria bacterium 33-17]|nr:MAG: membrane protein insertion efficiency factor YidD [Alphaproteobacteria bacterium 33-17]